MKIIGYRINITKNEYEGWKSKLDYNQTLTPEVVGVLFGRAEPILLKNSDEIIDKEVG